MRLGLLTGIDPERPATPDDQHAVPTSATPPGGFVPPEPAELNQKLPGLEIIELLGQGGMGAVYKARQKQLDRIVALKILPPEVGKDPAFAERFAREARSLARLNHPHIVTVYEFGQSDDDLYYFIMEFVDGTDLRHVIRAGELAAKEALTIVPQVCEALQYAHEEGIVHRDIKPENILLDRRGRVKIGDFGLAKLLDRPATAYTLTQPQQRMGTPHYMAPEQIEGAHQVDHRADIYSLGVVFYEMLTGKLPIGRFDPPSQKVHVDVRLDSVVLRSLEHEPERRYQHASEIKTDVELIAVDAEHQKPAGGRAAGALGSPQSRIGQARAVEGATGEAIAVAYQRLRIPAVGLVVTGLIDMLGLVGVLLLLGYFSLDPLNSALAIMPVAIFFVACLPGLIILTGGRRMSYLKSHGLAVAAAILALLPIHAGFLLGLPMGIWALIVLTRSDVQKAFSLAARSGAPKRKGFPLWSIALVLIILALLVLTPLLLLGMLATPVSITRSDNVGAYRETRYLPVTGPNEVTQPLTSEPNAPGYEKAQGTTTGKIKVGPTQFEVSAVARWDRKGIMLVENGLGKELRPYDFKTPDYSDQAAWMDIANIYITPDASRYDVLEVRVFDHRTRQLLQVGGNLALGYSFEHRAVKQTLADENLAVDKSFSASVIQLRSVGRLLPPVVDVWMRVLHTPENSPMWRLHPTKGSSASMGEISMLFRELRDGSWSYASKSGDSDSGQFPVGRVQWVKKNETDAAVCMAAFDFINVKKGAPGKSDNYQIAAVAKDGTRHIPDHPHFLTPRRGVTRVIEFDLSAEQISHFEIRPFLGRDRFYFDGLKLPRRSVHPSATAPTILIPVNGKEVDVISDGLSPAKLRVQVLKGKRAYGVRSSGIQGWVRMTEEPFENTDSMITLTYDIKGLAAENCSFNCSDAEGVRIAAGGRHSFASNPQGFTVGYWETNIPIDKISHIELSIGDSK
jgi:tRNA A-37 threonylcarbamoyl transferase component Bud32